ncbi:MAG: C25 family peptidase propeptide domain-containing protein, partial [bacterium]
MPGEKPIITVTHNSLDYTEYTVDIPGMWREQVMAPNGMIFDSIEIPEYGWTLDVGKPLIPVIRELFAVPYDSAVDISISDVQEVVIDDYYIYPSQPLYPYCEEPPPFEWDQDFYNSDVWYPGDYAVLSDEGGLMDVIVVNNHVQSFQYNPLY